MIDPRPPSDQSAAFLIVLCNSFFARSFQLPIPPGLSVYGEAEETASNIYESIDLQRECSYDDFFSRSRSLSLSPSLIRLDPLCPA